MKNTNLKKYVSVIVVLLLALVLGNLVGGYLLSTKTAPGKTASSSARPKESTQSAGPSKTTLNGAELKVPGPTATEEEKYAFSQQILTNAKATDQMEIGPSCSLSPQVAKVVDGSNFSFVNKDSTDHTLQTSKLEVKVSANSSKQIAIQLGGGTFGLRCDTTEMAGFLYITPKK